jgi:5-methylcytosine-specific restriction enzyme subunit McrC
MGGVQILLTEWESAGPQTRPVLRNLSLGSDEAVAAACDPLRSQLDVRQERAGVRIAATSFVGRVRVGPLLVTITPKLDPEPLSQLLRYGYGIDDLALQEVMPTSSQFHGLHDLLVAMLIHEVELLLRLGLARQYVRVADDLALPRGRIAVGVIAARGGLCEARLPCVFHDRKLDWRLHRVLRAGLGRAATLATPGQLARHAARLESSFAESVGSFRLDVTQVERAERELTRLTERYRPTLTLIRLICGADGVALEPTPKVTSVSGFLFDMNRFFQRLLSRFLRENLSDAHIEDERSIRTMLTYDPAANPRHQRAPAIRPDFAVFVQRKLRFYADAKYRDVWANGPPVQWLYQLHAYASAAPDKLSIMLYPTADPTAQPERIIGRPPAGEGPATAIVLRPLHLPTIASAVSRAGSVARRAALAREMVWGVKPSMQFPKYD